MVKQTLTDEETIRRFRVSDRDWTRQRCLTFDKTAPLILHGHKVPMQNNLNKLFKAMEQVEDVPTASAYCQARQKLQPELFLYLNQQVTAGFYELYGAEGQVRTCQGRRGLGVDGTYLNLPDNEEARQRYSVQTNQHDEQGCVQALASVLYDFEMERGSGQGVRSIEQDFDGVIFLATLERVLSKGAEAGLVGEGEEREWAYEPQVNHSVSYSAMLDYVGELFMDTGKDEAERLAELERLFATNPTWRREGRKYPRRRLTPSRQVRFYRYQKRICA